MVAVNLVKLVSAVNRFTVLCLDTAGYVTLPVGFFCNRMMGLKILLYK